MRVEIHDGGIQERAQLLEMIAEVGPFQGRAETKKSAREKNVKRDFIYLFIYLLFF